ncbi:MAG: hypothetical protein NXY57DRAFT_1036836 [Lentinula lateritia]|uniref:Uncharacterized protein n=1 Tax=Lentinula lateritia TaxID=40482 RepID=A0ABQ8V8V2_9AGAR|nr:MAG: hypothetical protein NXY57DRAFT_1036836 [Lentinula lateritia]KAJ4480772.1 hypothetical protein C8R41DRAFT_869060 [Lentinula lateritia]
MLLLQVPPRLLSVYSLLVTTLLGITVVAVPLIAPAPDIERRGTYPQRPIIVLAAKNMDKDDSDYVQINQGSLKATLWLTLFVGAHKGYEVVRGSNPLKITSNIASPRKSSSGSNSRKPKIDQTRLLTLGKDSASSLVGTLNDDHLLRETVWRTIGDAQELTRAIKKLKPESTVLEITDDLSHIAATFEYLTLVKNNGVVPVLKADDLKKGQAILRKMRALRSEEKSR